MHTRVRGKVVDVEVTCPSDDRFYDFLAHERGMKGLFVEEGSKPRERLVEGGTLGFRGTGVTGTTCRGLNGLVVIHEPTGAMSDDEMQQTARDHGLPADVLEQRMKVQRAKTELAAIHHKLKQTRTQVAALEERKAELMAESGK